MAESLLSREHAHPSIGIGILQTSETEGCIKKLANTMYLN